MGAFPTETVENEDDENAPLIPKKREVAIEEQSKVCFYEAEFLYTYLVTTCKM